MIISFYIMNISHNDVFFKHEMSIWRWIDVDEFYSLLWSSFRFSIFVITTLDDPWTLVWSIILCYWLHSQWSISTSYWPLIIILKKHWIAWPSSFLIKFLHVSTHHYTHLSHCFSSRLLTSTILHSSFSSFQFIFFPLLIIELQS